MGTNERRRIYGKTRSRTLVVMVITWLHGIIELNPRPRKRTKKKKNDLIVRVHGVSQQQCPRMGGEHYDPFQCQVQLLENHRSLQKTWFRYFQERHHLCTQVLLMDMIKAEPENDPLAIPNDDTNEEPQSVVSDFKVDDFLKNCTEAIKVEPDLGYHILSDKKFEENEGAISLPRFKFKVEEDSSFVNSIVKAEPLSEVETDDVTFTESAVHLDCHDNVRRKVNDVVQLGIEEKGNKCNACGKDFSNSTLLLYHACILSNEKLVKCNICSKIFSHQKHLKIHMRCHTGENPYKCDVCGKEYGNWNKLQNHARVHTREKPFKCDVCRKDFSSKRNLSIHMRIRTGDGGTQSIGTENTVSKIKSSVELDCKNGDFSSGSSEDHNPELNKFAYINCMDDEERKSTEEKGKGACKVSGTAFEENSPIRCKRGGNSSQKCLNKEKRMRGQDYAGIRKDEFGRKKLIVPRQRRIMKSRCMCKHSFVNGKRNCSEVTEEQRKLMFDHFWNEMSWSDRKMFIKGLVDYLPVKRRRNQSESSHRSNTLHYNFVIEGQRKSVCKVMFLNTLCLGEWSVRNWVTGL
ncbi:hypothetical protein ANN_00212 [Periplaneta americana]|uniref:C2H2-type domain-containing protein n=1 Tax=Periplaneta americana TaxID=6978 RepID=A0ABQ8TRT0_PERAM|nr:hypothetical protein ANN_00212 [Periplaneta americana]